MSMHKHVLMEMFLLVIVRGQDFMDPATFEVTFVRGTSIPGLSNISIATLNDDAWEGPQTFMVSITDTTHGVSIGIPYNQSVEIIDNDSK